MVNHDQYRSQPGKVITTLPPPFEDVEEGVIRRTESNRSELLCSAALHCGWRTIGGHREDDRDGTN